MCFDRDYWLFTGRPFIELVQSLLRETFAIWPVNIRTVLFKSKTMV